MVRHVSTRRRARSSAAVPVGVALAAAPAVSDGTLLVGGGIGQRTGNPAGSSDQSASIPHDLTALCVPGTPDCATDVPIAKMV
jgi:hypothetical protein